MALFAKSRQGSLYRSYLRGRLRAAGLLDDKEATVYADPALPTQLLVGFVLGCLADTDDPLPGEAEVEAAVRMRLAPATPPASTPSAPPAGDAEPTQRVRLPRWIGDPLPSGA